MAPSTPPAAKQQELAALTIASTSSFVMSPITRPSLGPGRSSGQRAVGFAEHYGCDEPLQPSLLGSVRVAAVAVVVAGDGR